MINIKIYRISIYQIIYIIKSFIILIFHRTHVHLTIPENIKLLADSGYQGICHYHQNSEIPIKSSKKHPLSEEEKQYNHELSKRRIYIEHINCFLKRFRILSSKYRNRRKRFALRVSLICGIYNFQF